ncbi:MAG: hypothetical protein ABS888_00870, partial [Eubacteriales bacterium]
KALTTVAAAIPGPCSLCSTLGNSANASTNQNLYATLTATNEEQKERFANFLKTCYDGGNKSERGMPLWNSSI